ncbi:MAG: twin-arginine translocation signal domain-containing protein [Anaerolineales bacterium]|nr:MAG: twin-arginine translocation signal domain-containing protein [Anaerolineales bacterium]
MGRADGRRDFHGRHGLAAASLGLQPLRGDRGAVSASKLGAAQPVVFIHSFFDHIPLDEFSLDLASGLCPT